MDLRSFKWTEETPAIRVEQLLESNYGKLLKWSIVLTRGDVGKAEEIVQEFCLYIALTKPDLRSVTNLDGYLYTCLRNLYQSSLARSTREAMQFVSVAEFDTIRFALAGNQGGDPLQRQNDLRRICSYAVWRKEQSKSFSYLILHFFHGYFRREIAEMAGVPLSAIYNKLRTARSEVKAHLEQPDRLRIVTRDTPPPPVLFWHQISAAELFKELRKTILDARNSACPTEEDLLARYRGPAVRPLPCSLLSHLVSCVRCLAVVDRHFHRPTLKDREPLDSTGSPEDSTGKQETPMGSMNYQSLLRTVRDRLDDIYEHRPRTLSIAVNGKIIALHDVQGKHSTLAARIEQPEKTRFIEVFSEQDVRFALLPVGDAPPEGPHTVTQRVALSDDRWLELHFVFDGLGLNSEVAYFDPVLAIAAEAAEVEEEDNAPAILTLEQEGATPVSDALLQTDRSSIFAKLTRWLRSTTPSPVMAWALMLMIAFCVAGYFAYRHANAPMDAKQILSQSINLEATALQGQTEHQVLQVQELAANGHITRQATVDVWKDGDGGRYIRRLYNPQHRMAAAEWRVRNATHSSYAPGEAADFSGIPWNQDVSARAFGELTGKEPELYRTNDEYELTVAGPTEAQPHLMSATLVLNRRLLPVREIMRIRGDAGVYEVHFVQTSYSRTPSRSVPDTAFEPEDRSLSSNDWDRRSSLLPPFPTGSDPQLAELEIAALYQLSQMGADTGEPIEVAPTADGHVRIFGAVTDNARKKELLSRLNALPNHQLLDIRLASQRDAQISNLKSLRKMPGVSSMYESSSTKPPADALVRRYFERKGLDGARLDATVAQFSSSVLTLAQHALQNAYALDRLGNILSTTGVDTVSLSSREQWTEMVEKHASTLETQMQSLNKQLSGILPPSDQSAETVEMPDTIGNAAEFARSARRLLRQVQEVNQNVDSAFASGAVPEKSKNVEAMLASTTKMLPVRQTIEMADIARLLTGSEVATTAQKHPQKMEMPVAPR